MKRPLLALTLGISFFSLHAQAARVDGATAVIDAINKAQAEKKDQNAKDDGSSVKKALEAFSMESPKLQPAEAAGQWMGFVKEWASGRTPLDESSGYSADGGFNLFISHVPGPVTWDEIQKLADAGATGDSLNDALLQLFAATLRNDESAKWKAFGSFKDQLASPSADSKSPLLRKLVEMGSGREVGQFFDSFGGGRLASALAKLSDDPAHILEALEIELQSLSRMEAGRAMSIAVPDLVTIVGEEKARAFLKSVFGKSIVLEVRGARTEALAQTLALESVSKLKAAQWSLVSGIRKIDIDLYKALAKKFPDGSRNDQGWESARGYYLLSLIAAGKTKEAKDFVLATSNSQTDLLSYGGMAAMQAAGFGPQLYEFVHALLQQDPNLPLWSEYVALAAEAGKTAEARELAKISAQRENLSPEQRRIVLAQLCDAYLADGAVDEALPIMREQLKAAREEEKTGDDDVLRLAMEITDLGRLLKRPDLFAEGLGEALSAARESKSTSVHDGLITLLMEAGRHEEAQQLILSALKSTLMPEGENYGGGYYSPRDAASPLAALAGFYDALDRPDDVLTLLKQAPWWGGKDLVDVVSSSDYRDIPLGVIAARAFVAKGNKAEAIAALQATIRSSPSSDKAYAMLIEMQGTAALPFLEKAFARDRFQERPLIWQAVILMKEKKITEADKIIRQAIAIDPSDGEMGRGDRMRAYAVLADVLEAQGKPEEAKIYRGAVQAVRLSEDADQFQEAGLLSQAVAMYEQALTYFADAYCIQSRLAIQLAKLGDMKKAEEHYRRAYELMPDSFGRMESHCFGCEKAFKGELAETLAEKTFTQLIAANPAKPQLHYLLGYLRMEQDRYPEALAHFQKAVELDPDYINAWRKILSVARNVAISTRQRDDAILAILRLDPFSSSRDLREVADLKRLWDLLTQLRQDLPAEPTAPIFPLDASEKAIAEASTQMDRHGRNHGFDRGQEEETITSPADALTSHELIQQISQMLTQLARFAGER